MRYTDWLVSLGDPVRDKLDDVGVELDCQLRSRHRSIDRATVLLRRGASKRLRPAVLLLSAGACGYRGDDDVALAAAAELIHMATLVHDDIIDEAPMRRGQPSANEAFGNATAVLLGDLLFAKALTLVQRDVRGVAPQHGRAMLGRLADMTLEMIEGQLLEQDASGNLALTEAEYLRMIGLKTGEQVATCCQLGAMVSRAPQRIESALRGYGLDLGIAFQLVDDLIDVTLDAQEAGKETGVDLLHGNVSLAVIRLLERGTAEDRDIVERVIAGADAAAMPHLRARLCATETLRSAQDTAVHYAEQGRRRLMMVPKSPFRDALAQLPDAVLSQIPYGDPH